MAVHGGSLFCEAYGEGCDCETRLLELAQGRRYVASGEVQCDWPCEGIQVVVSGIFSVVVSVSSEVWDECVNNPPISASKQRRVSGIFKTRRWWSKRSGTSHLFTKVLCVSSSHVWSICGKMNFRAVAHGAQV